MKRRKDFRKLYLTLLENKRERVCCVCVCERERERGEKERERERERERETYWLTQIRRKRKSFFFVHAGEILLPFLPTFFFFYFLHFLPKISPVYLTSGKSLVWVYYAHVRRVDCWQNALRGSDVSKKNSCVCLLLLLLLLHREINYTSAPDLHYLDIETRQAAAEADVK